MGIILPPLAALVLFALWTMLLVVAVGVWRSNDVMTGRRRINEFPSGTQHGSEMYWRLNRAHLNAVENLPIFAVVVLSGTILRVPDLSFQVLPSIVLLARIAQSTIHISSGSAVAVTLRFTAYVVQLLAMSWMAFCILGATGTAQP